MQKVSSLRSSLLNRVLLILGLALSSPALLIAQSPDPTSQPPQVSPAVPSQPAPGQSPEVVRTRIERARALVAAHQLETASSELESVRAATADSSIRTITSVMLMNIYLEAGNYGRAEALLEENFRSRSAESGGAYFALAGQAINGARTHLARYRGLGINTSAQNLPVEAVNDLDRLRSFLERMIAQAKEICQERKGYDSLSLLEDVLAVRLSLAKDSDEQNKWGNEYTSARELLASQTQVALTGVITALPPGKATGIKTTTPYTSHKSPDSADAKAAEKSHSTTQSPPQAVPIVENSVSKSGKLADFGLLNFKASKRVLPRYPPLAKQAGTSGLVRVHVVVDETGKVVEVSQIEGPLLLRQVAEDAAKGWYFEGIRGPDQTAPAGRFTGYIDFNFTL